MSKISRVAPSHAQITEAALDLDVLERVAREATPGPWTIDGGTVLISAAPWPMEYGPSWQDWEARGGEPMGRFIAETRTAEVEGEDNAAFIATFDPPTVLRLIALARASQEATHDGSSQKGNPDDE